MIRSSRDPQQHWRGDENDAMNARNSVLPAEEQRVGTSVKSFDELLARELAKSQQQQQQSNASSSQDAPVASARTGERKKPFLKKGDRGWWMERPGAKAKVVKHVLASKDVDGIERESRSSKATTTTTNASASQRGAMQQSSSRRSASLERPQSRTTDSFDPQQQQRRRIEPLRPSAASVPPPPPLERLTPPPPSYPTNTWPPSPAPSRLSDSMRTTTSVETVGLSRVRASFAAQRERDADELADFEAIERALAAEKDAYRREQHASISSTDVSHTAAAGVHDDSATASRYHHHTSARSSSSSNDQELNGHSSLLFVDDRDANADGSATNDRFQSSAFADLDDAHRGSDDGVAIRRSRYAASELSALSLNDSDAWTDDRATPAAHVRRSTASRLLDAPSDTSPRSYGSCSSTSTSSNRYGRRAGHLQSQQQSQQQRRQVAYSDDDDGSFDGVASGSSRDSCSSSSSGRSSKRAYTTGDGPPVSQLMQQFFSSSQHSDTASTDRFEYSASQRLGTSHAAASSNRVGARLSTHKSVTSRKSSSTQQRTNGKPSGATAKPRSTANGPLLPTVIEEKLFELEAEVKFYKAETLQLQRKTALCDQTATKLAAERDAFAHWQHEQRALIAQEWAAERLKMKREAKLVDRQLKLKLSAAATHHDRRDRSEIDALKAQIVAMQLDEKARAAKWKAMHDSLRQRVAELEEKNRELSDEIKFLEHERLEQWGKFEALRQSTQRTAESSSAAAPPHPSAAAPVPTHLDTTHFDLDAERDLRTVNDLSAIKDTADELLRGWQDHCNDSNETQCGASSSDATAAIGTSERVPPPPDANDTTNQTSASGLTNSRTVAFADTDSDTAPTHSSGATNKHVERDVVHPGGKREVVYSDGSRVIVFADGNEKEIDAHGRTTIRFTNGDRKELFPDTGISIYYYYEAKTTLTTYPDKTKVYEFPNQQVETSYVDGTTEIAFADGITKTIRPNGDEFSVFPDGTTMLEQTNGLREVTLLNDKKIRYFPDGAMAWVTPQGVETPVRSDAELKRLMDGL